MNTLIESCCCIWCNGALRITGHKTLICSRCGRCYPVVDGIPVFTARGRQVLGAYIRQLGAERTYVKKLEYDLAMLIRNKDHELSRRAEQMMMGLYHNVELMEKHCGPIMECMDISAADEDLLAWATIETGFSYREMLPYFYQDWHGASGFRRVAKLFDNTVNELCEDRGSVAVLGAGACGLFYTLSAHFSRAFAVDLSLPTLLTAKHLIYGDSISLYLENADWRRVDLSPPAHLPSDRDMTFIVANVMTLPFRDESISVIITQYLVDIVGDPVWLMDEIRRVLRPLGIWINFSQPFRAPNDPTPLRPRSVTEVSPLLTAAGFEARKLETQRFGLLDMQEIWAGGDRHEHEVHFCVAQKLEYARQPQQLRARCRSIGKNELWERIPKLRKEREITLIRKKRFSPPVTLDEWEIGVVGQRISVAEQNALLLEELLSHIDGVRPLREVWKALCRDNGGMDGQKFLELMCCLSIDHAVVELC